MDSDVDDAYLVRRAQDGFVDAYELLVRRHAPAAYRVAYRLVGNHHDAQDVAQESFLAAWQGLPRYRSDAAFSTWMYRIVTRRALNRLTRTRILDGHDMLEALPDPARGPEASAEQAGARHAVASAVAALPPAQRVVVVLHHFEGLTYAEVAAITNSTAPAVRSHLHRARRALALSLMNWR